MINVGHRSSAGLSTLVSRPLGVALLTMAITAPAVADPGRVERLQHDAWGAGDMAIPDSGQGVLRTRTQLVWDKVEGKLTRRTYQAWDFLPDKDLEFVWKPYDTHTDNPGPITGKGTLLWQRPGAPAYDPAAAIASYQGELKEGRPDGAGNYWHRSGLTYRGEWRNGVMHGDGRLLLPNGDEYVGGFRDGRRDGQGVYVDSGGSSYDGSFIADARDGKGTVVGADANAYHAVFRSGIEVPGTRVRLPPSPRRGFVTVSDYPSYPDTRIGVNVERRSVLESADMSPLFYTQESDGETLRMFPDNPRFMDVWRGRTEIQLTQQEEHSHSTSMSVLDGRLRFEPVPIVFQLENLSGKTLGVLGAFLDVGESVTDPEPFIQLSAGGSYAGCGGNIGGTFKSTFRLENYGWAPAENARLRLEFIDPTARKTVAAGIREIGTIDKLLEVDLIEELTQAGVNTSLARSRSFRCSSDDEAKCVKEIAASGILGSLGDLVRLESPYFLVDVRGTLEYQWHDATQTVHDKASPFTATLFVSRKHTEVECGEGGYPSEIRHEPFRFQLDRKNYRIPIPLRDDVPPGVTARWRIKLEAEKSSSHHFRFVLQMVDRREIASRPMQLLYARPASINEPASGGASSP